MTNLKEDCEAGVIDAIVMLGDHAYDMGSADGLRGDAYMNAFQPTLATCPWLPIIGNHEGNDGDGTNRYANMTYGVSDVDSMVSDTTRPLTELLSKSTLVGASSTGVPSGNSRFFSADLGLVHWIALDLLPTSQDDPQVAWLQADLQAVDRSKTPWLVVSSHYPIYHASVAVNRDASAAEYESDDAEKYAKSGHEFVPALDGERTVGDLVDDASSILLPLFDQYKVDVFDAGHIHDYCSTYPMCYDGAGAADLCPGFGPSFGDVYVDAPGTVHVTEGNGGVPGVTANTVLENCTRAADWCRTHGTEGGAHGRWIVNSTHLVYQHVQNAGSNVTDTFTLVKATTTRAKHH